MSSPIYTATAGPADPNGGFRAKLYAGLAVVVPLLSFLATLGILTSDQVNSINAALTAVTGLLGTFGFGLAAVKTHKQNGNGTFDPPPVISTAEQIANAIPAVVQGLTDKQAEVELIKNVAANVLGDLPIVGGAAADLIRQIPSDLHLP